MSLNFFVTDLHGRKDRYNKLFQKILEETPKAVFLGGDLLPSGIFSIDDYLPIASDFIENVLFRGFEDCRSKLRDMYPRVFLILGNDDSRIEEDRMLIGEQKGLWEYMHNKKSSFGNFNIYGYSCVPPTPFLFKDWERYDVSRFVDPGCVPPEEGFHSVPFKKDDILFGSIQKDLDMLTENDDVSNSVCLFHTPPYQTNLDRADLDGKKFNYVPLDVNVGSIALKRFIENRQPLLTLHGHIHESTMITGSWKDTIGKTYAFNAAHHGSELSLIKFDLENLQNSTRELI